MKQTVGIRERDRPRRTFSGGWAVAYDTPQQRSAFGIAGTRYGRTHLEALLESLRFVSDRRPRGRIPGGGQYAVHAPLQSRDIARNSLITCLEEPAYD